MLALAILVLLIHTPFLQRAFELAPLTIKDYLYNSDYLPQLMLDRYLKAIPNQISAKESLNFPT
ncbi:MAG: hypothetical protein ACKO75_03275 [Actinomycetales bacterium]